jgi:MacB-like periplasmic core domain
MKRLLRWALPARSEEALADLLDLYERRAARVGRARARLRLVSDLITLVAFGVRGALAQIVVGLPGDLRCALRVIRKSPAFSAAAVLILALGIGANTAIFSVVNVLLLTPIPSDDREVVGIYWRDTGTPGRYRSFSYHDYQTIRAAGPPFGDVVAYTFARLGLTERGGDTRRTSGVIATSNYFRLLETRLAIGREFTPEEERPGSDTRVVIAGFRYWQAHGKSPSILGTTVRLNGRDYAIVGVTPEGFTGILAADRSVRTRLGRYFP